VVVKAKLGVIGVVVITEITRGAVVEDVVKRVTNGSLATVGPEVVLIDAIAAIALTIIINAHLTVELAEVVADSVTSNVELDIAKTIVNPARSAGLVVSDAIVGVASDDGVILAQSVGLVAVEVSASSAATSAVKVRIVEHAASEVVRLERVSAVLHVVVVRNSGLVVANVTPVPVSTAILSIGRSSKVNAALTSEDVAQARVAVAIEDVAEVV